MDTQDVTMRRIDEIEAQQEELRNEIDALPQHHPERERKIDLLFVLHAEIDNEIRQVQRG